MNNLKLVETDVFNEIATCDFWGNANNEYLVTREQIGRALGYSNPANAIKNIHLKHKERLDKFSTQLTLGYVEGDRYVERERILYNRKGIMEICRWSRQPLADKFMDWCWEIMDRLISNSLNTVTLSREEYSMIINTVNEVGQLNKVNEQLTRQLQIDIYNMMRSDYDIDLDSYKENYLLSQIDCKNVAMIDVIDSDTALRDIFEEIVDRYIQIKSGMEVMNNA